MFNISIINSTSNTDCFFYSIDGITYSINKTTTYIDHKISHSKLILNMNLGCKISSYGRCIISNYYLMVMKVYFIFNNNYSVLHYVIDAMVLQINIVNYLNKKSIILITNLILVLMVIIKQIKVVKDVLKDAKFVKILINALNVIIMLKVNFIVNLIFEG